MPPPSVGVPCGPVLDERKPDRTIIKKRAITDAEHSVRGDSSPLVRHIVGEVAIVHRERVRVSFNRGSGPRPSHLPEQGPRPSSPVRYLRSAARRSRRSRAARGIDGQFILPGPVNRNALGHRDLAAGQTDRLIIKCGREIDGVTRKGVSDRGPKRARAAITQSRDGEHAQTPLPLEAFYSRKATSALPIVMSSS